VTAKDAPTAFDSSSVIVAERPVGVITIAGREYKIRCPKLRVWIAMIERQEDYDAGQALKPHIQEIYRKLSASPGEEERGKLIEQYSVIQPTFGRAPTALQLAELLLDFLCSCMTDKSSADELRTSYNDDGGECDIPHLRLALDEMDEVFSTWIDEQSDLVGVARPEPVERPEPVNREARRATARKKPATKAGTKRAAAAAG
jgi:hypothetical protein